MQPKVTIVLPVSRAEHLSLVFTALETLNCVRSQTYLFVMVDGDDDLFLTARNLAAGSKFGQALAVPYSKRGQTASDIFSRRLRIADIHNEIKTYLLGDFSAEYILGIEDDTVVGTNTIKYLLEDFIENPDAGFIQGVELGRWGQPYVGAWRADDIYEPREITSILPPEDGPDLETIDAGGFYCFMAKKDIYATHQFQPFQDNGMGPDAEFGMSLRERGYSNFIDWRIKCIHLNGNEKISTFTHKPVQVGFRKPVTRKKWSFFVK